MDGINTILRIVTWALIPVVGAAALSQLQRPRASTTRCAAPSPAWSAMVPEGLVLLTSVAFGVAAVTLARRKVLVQELPAVEGLARVDVVCLDKTGTLTEGDDRVRRARAARRATTPTTPRRARRARRRRRTATPPLDALGRGVRRRPTAGRAPARCRSRRPASGARRRFDGHGRLGARRARDGARPTPTIPARGAGRRARGRAGGGCCCWRTADAPLDGEALPAGPRAGRAGDVRGEGPARRRRDARLLRRAGRDAQGDLGRQPAHGRRGRRRGSGSPAPTTPSTPASCPRTTRRWPTCSSSTRCSAGSRRSRSGRWSARCSRGATSSR